MLDPQILVVEDEYFVAEAVAEVVRSLGAEVVGPFGRLAPAFDAARREPIRGAVLDVRLDGEVICALAAELQDRGVPILLATGQEVEDLPENLRAVPRVKKPYRPRELRCMIEALLRETASEPA